MAIVGLRDQVSMSAQRRCAVTARKRATGSLSVSRKYCLRSIPALQLLPAPIFTMTLVASSVSCSNRICSISTWRVGFIALRFSGRLNVIQVIPSSSVSTRTQLYSFFLAIWVLLQEIVCPEILRSGSAKSIQAQVSPIHLESLIMKGKVVDFLYSSQEQ